MIFDWPSGTNRPVVESAVIQICPLCGFARYWFICCNKCYFYTYLFTFFLYCWNCNSFHSFQNISLLWRHNGHNSVSNHQPHDCLLKPLLRRTSKETSKLRFTGFCAGNSPRTGEFPAQVASNVENVSISWRHHDGCHQSPEVVNKISIAGSLYTCWYRVGR